MFPWLFCVKYVTINDSYFLYVLAVGRPGLSFVYKTEVYRILRFYLKK